MSVATSRAAVTGPNRGESDFASASATASASGSGSGPVLSSDLPRLLDDLVDFGRRFLAEGGRFLAEAGRCLVEAGRHGVSVLA